MLLNTLGLLRNAVSQAMSVAANTRTEHISTLYPVQNYKMSTEKRTICNNVVIALTSSVLRCAQRDYGATSQSVGRLDGDYEKTCTRL